MRPKTEITKETKPKVLEAKETEAKVLEAKVLEAKVLEAKVFEECRGNEVTRVTHRMAAEDRRAQILDVALQLFSQKGFRGTTTKEIAQAAGVNEAIIFRHFATKSELYAAIIDRKGEEGRMQEMHALLHQMMETRADKQVFETLALTMLDFHTQDETPLRVLYYSALEGNELSQMVFRKHIAQVHRALANYIKLRIREGAFRKIDPMTAVRGFVGMVMSQAMLTRFFTAEARELLDISNKQAAERFTDIFLTGIKAAPSATK